MRSSGVAFEPAVGRGRFDHMVELRREFHRHPELAFEERETARRVMGELEKLGIPYDYDGVGSGVVGRLRGGGSGAPVVALRAEMDALPGTETTGLSFAPDEPGKMHACGHDAHMAMVLGAASMLVEDPPEGDVVFVFQPAEEKGGGSRKVLESGHVDDVEAIFAVHVTHHYDLGEMMVKDGVVTAQSDAFYVDITGKGGHGARPHEAIDAVIIAGSFINTIQTLVSREVDPLHPSVVTIGEVHAGSAPNVIAETARLTGTIRTTLSPIREHIHKGMRRTADALSALHNASIDIEIREGYPPVQNTAEETEWAREAAAEIVGADNLKDAEHPSMGAEDFSFFLQKIPGVYARLGARLPECEYIPLHSPAFDIDERALDIGARYFDRVARKAIAKIETGDLESTGGRPRG